MGARESPGWEANGCLSTIYYGGECGERRDSRECCQRRDGGWVYKAWARGTGRCVQGVGGWDFKKDKFVCEVARGVCGHPRAAGLVATGPLTFAVLRVRGDIP